MGFIKLLKTFAICIYSFVLFDFVSSAFINIRDALYFSDPKLVYYNLDFAFLQIPMMIFVSVIIHLGIMKLCRVLFNKPARSVKNKTGQLLLFAFLICAVMTMFSSFASKQELFSDGSFRRYDLSGRVKTVGTIDDTERIVLKTEKHCYFSRRAFPHIYYTIGFYYHLSDKDTLYFGSDRFKDKESMKTIKDLAEDRLVVEPNEDLSVDIASTGERDVYEKYVYLFFEPEDDYHTYYEDYEIYKALTESTYFQFG